jgi:nondiscriminating aspartyl-tRNA synthetase
MERNYVEEVFKKQAGEKVCLKGWVYDARDLKKVRFIVLRDITGRVQVTGVQNETPAEAFEGLNGISRESAVEVIGTIKDCKQAPGGKEIAPEKITILAMAANPIPIDVSDYSKTELPIRLDYRFLDLHREKTQAIFKIQSTIMQAYREYMVKEERALEGVFPSIIGSSSEGGTELFEAKYFEKKAFLSQSCQLYKQMLACSMEKVFTIFTVWRAEKHNTVRHLNEARQMDFEMAFADEFAIMDVLAKSVIYIVKKVIEVNSKELKLLNVNLKVPEVKYITFAEAAKIMKEANVGMPKHDLSGEAEKKLDELYPDTIVFVHDWPEEGRGFYIMPKEGPNGEKLSHGFDAIYKGIEISSGGQRVHLPELLTERLKAKGLNPVQFKDYIDSFRYGAPPHGGFGVGLERITMIMLGLDNIREAVLFPRDRDRLTP